MYKMKNCTLIAILALSLPTLSVAETKATCMIYGQSGKHGKTKIPVFSDHGFSITNPFGVAKVFHVEYQNAIMYQNPYYSPNAKKVIDMPVDAGKTLIYGPERINQAAYFSIADRYPIQATTTIAVDGKVIARCSNTNTMTAF